MQKINGAAIGKNQQTLGTDFPAALHKEVLRRY